MNEGVRIHATAIIEPGVEIGPRTSIWDHVHVRRDTRIGADCSIGGKTLIAYEVVIGDMVKINSAVYICYGVTLERGVLVGAGTIFTNDRFPRATNPELTAPRSADPDEHTLLTRVREGASIGAGAIIGCDLTIGRWAMVGMGSVVTRTVPDFHLVVGSPARSIAALCRCGQLVYRFDGSWPAGSEPLFFEPVAAHCPACQRNYRIEADQSVSEIA
jgi:UDP-2-acetamido-3-amino-2,3-dideoxy-glucuronate N-acetyltransferase